MNKAIKVPLISKEFIVECEHFDVVFKMPTQKDITKTLDEVLSDNFISFSKPITFDDGQTQVNIDNFSDMLEQLNPVAVECVNNCVEELTRIFNKALTIEKKSK